MPEMLQAYHTSVTVEDAEYTFSNVGIVISHGLQSHASLGKGPPIVVDMGTSKVSRTAMLNALRPHFLPGTYDLLRKNCNTFSDCCLAHMLGKRLDEKYASIEKIGSLADKHTRLIWAATGGSYTPNPRADGFQLTTVVEEVRRRAVGPR